MNCRQTGSALVELSGALVGLVLLGSLVVAALGGVRQRTRIEANSARLEDAQNLLARWRHGEDIVAPGWTCTRQTGANHTEILIIQGEGVRLSSIRPSPVSP